MLIKFLLFAAFVLLVVGVVTQITLPVFRNERIFPILRRRAAKPLTPQERLEQMRLDLADAHTEAEVARLEAEIEELLDDIHQEQARAHRARSRVPGTSARGSRSRKQQPRSTDH